MTRYSLYRAMRVTCSSTPVEQSACPFSAEGDEGEVALGNLIFRKLAINAAEPAKVWLGAQINSLRAGCLHLQNNTSAV